MLFASARAHLIPDHKVIDERHCRIKKINQYALVDVIGQSSYGKVYLALNCDTGAPYAAKVIALNGLRSGGPALEREVRLLRLFDHPNILKLHEVLHAKRLGLVYVILEWASWGSLSHALQPGLSEQTVAAIFRQVCAGLAAMHSQNHVHHDIKPSNILLFGDGVAKLSDFGIGHSVASADTVIGTPAYQAPEFFDDSSDVELDPVKEDIWSLGVSMYEAAFGRLPFTGANVYEISWNVLHTPLQIPETASASLRDLLMKMLELNPAKRISLEEIRGHAFLENAAERFELSEPPAQPPKLNPGRSMSYVVANVCDETYTFVKKQLSGSSPAFLGGYF
jgi:serine/threonine-protein kinase 11